MASPGDPRWSRRAVLVAAPAAWLAACEPKMRTTVSTTPRIDQEGLTKAVTDIAVRARPGALGVGLMNLESGEAFLMGGDHRFPMQSVFKLPLAAAVLSEVDAGHFRLDERFVLTGEQLSAPYSPIGAAWPARREYTGRELLTAVVVDSDNTAADVLMKRIGGPGVLTAWLDAKHVPGIRVDRYEREFACEIHGMASFRPAWRTEAAFTAVLFTVPPAQRLAARRTYMADPRDTATPRGMLDLLQKLNREELISPAPTRLLLKLMSQTPRAPNRIRAGLPRDAFLAHRPGTSDVDQGISAAHNDVGIFTLADRRAYSLAVFLSGSTLGEAARDAVLADVTRAAVRAIG